MQNPQPLRKNRTARVFFQKSLGNNAQYMLNVEKLDSESSITWLIRKVLKLADSCRKYSDLVELCPIELSKDYHVGTRTVFQPQRTETFIPFSKDALVTNQHNHSFYHVFEWHGYPVEELQVFKELQNHTQEDCHDTIMYIYARIGTEHEKKTDKLALKLLQQRLDNDDPEYEASIIQERIKLLEDDTGFAKALNNLGVHHISGAVELLQLMVQSYRSGKRFIKGEDLQEKTGKSKSTLGRYIKALKDKNLISNQKSKGATHRGYYLTYTFFDEIKKMLEIIQR